MSSMSDLPAGVEWLHEGTEERQDFDGSYAQAEFYVPGDAIDAFRTAVGGLPEELSIGSTTYTRLVPLRYDRFDNCYADSLTVRGGGRSRPPDDGSLGILYDYYVARVSFSTLPFRFDGSTPAITLSLDVGSDMVTRPGTAYRFPSDNRVVPHNVGVPIPTIDFSLTFHRVPTLDLALYTALAGRVSTLPFLDMAAGTVLYLGPGANGEKTIGNVVSFDVQHKFRFRWVEHNKIMRPDGAGFEAPVQVGDATKGLLPTDDLNALWG